MRRSGYGGGDEVIIGCGIYLNEGKRIDVKVWGKRIELRGGSKDLKKVLKRVEEYDDWWDEFKKKNGDGFGKDGKYVKWINGVLVIEKRVYEIGNRRVR